MCELGLALGILTGAAQAADQAQAVNQKNELAKQTADIEHAGQAREFLIRADAANKDAYQASLEGDRARASVIAKGEGMGGSTAAARAAEQGRQTALSIQNAKDAREGARANYLMQGNVTRFEQNAGIKTRAMNPLSTFTNIATSGIQNYGAFR